jgi:S-adenosyl methyltransferase
MRQFLDIGTGRPSASNVHEVAQPGPPVARLIHALPAGVSWNGGVGRKPSRGARR